MQYIRFQTGNGRPEWGWIYEDRVGLIDGWIFGSYRRLEAEIPLMNVRLLAPIESGKIICVGRNYIDHAREQGVDVPEIPLIFLKPSSSLTGYGAPIYLPPQSNQVEHEAELAVIIGKRGRWIPAERSLDYIFGYTCANDVTARDLQRRDGQWTRGKGFDSFCPVGPWIETDYEPFDSLITCRVNGEIRQMGSTRDMVFPVQQLVAFISSVMTLEPGDIILTGTPAGIGPLHVGDRVEVDIEGVGTLINPVENEPGTPRI